MAIGAVYLAIALLLLPMLVYMYQFGISISNDHKHWAEFGDAMSGIYAPILGVLTLLLLARQVVIQNNLTNRQQDQDYLNGNRADLDFALMRLDQYLAKTVYGENLSSSLKVSMRFTSLDDMTTGKAAQVAQFIEQQCPGLFATWGSVYSNLAGLRSSLEPMYNLAYRSSILKLHSFLSWEICVCLDHFHFVMSDCEGFNSYEFSTILSTEY